MFTQSVVRSVLATAFTLTLTASAFAHGNPALTRAQARAAHATACDAKNIRSGASYRDAMRRFGPATARSNRVAGAGYRDAIRRFGPRQAPSVACTTSTRSASR
jgi:hypothetical protein